MYLRCFISDAPQTWTKYLALAEYWYHSTLHPSIGMSPFEALYGRSPPPLTGYVPGESKFASLDDLLTQRALNLKLIKENLTRARNRMTQQASKKRTEKTLEVHDWVYLKLQPHRQLSLKHHRSQKIVKRFYGPFHIVRHIGPVAYELDLPSTAPSYSSNGNDPYSFANPASSFPQHQQWAS